MTLWSRGLALLARILDLMDALHQRREHIPRRNVIDFGVDVLRLAPKTAELTTHAKLGRSISAIVRAVDVCH